jgi:hypothetical protein
MERMWNTFCLSECWVKTERKVGGEKMTGVTAAAEVRRAARSGSKHTSKTQPTVWTFRTLGRRTVEWVMPILTYLLHGAESFFRS